jgi:uncharacterized protein DUF4342
MSTPLMSEPVHTEEHKVRGEQLLAKVKEIIHRGNTRRIIIKSEEGHTILEIPLTLGVVTAVLVPVWVAVGAIAALAADYTVLVEKEPEVDEQCQ